MPERPYPNEHAFRLTDPDKYKRIRRQNNKFGIGIHAILGILDEEGEEKTELQAIRFDSKEFTFAEAKEWIKDHDYKPILEEEATGKEQAVPGGLFYRDASFQPQSFNANENTIDLLWSTGARVRRQDFWGGSCFDEELSMELSNVRLSRLNTVGILLNAHNGWDLSAVIGRVVPKSAVIKDNQGWAKIKLSSEEADKTIVNKIKEGLIPGISMGYVIHKEERISGGGDGGVDLHLAIDWEPYELSAVPMGADAGAQFRNFGGKENMENKTDEGLKKLEEEKRLESGRLDAQRAEDAKLETQRLDALRAEESRKVEEVKLLERTRIADIQKVGRGLHCDEKLVEELVKSGADIEKARAQLIEDAVKKDSLHQTHSAMGIELVSDEKKKRWDAMEAALCHRAAPDKFKADGLYVQEYRGMRLIDIARECLELMGTKTRGMTHMEIASKALTMRGSGGLSTSDFPYLLAAVSGKTLRKAYEDTSRTFLPFCSMRNVPDFKTQRELVLSTGPSLEKVNEEGEYKYGTLTEGQETWSIATYGKIIRITRQIIVNDDLSAFTRLPMLLGNAASRKESDVVWALITANGPMADNEDLFSAAHSNLGTGGAIDAEHLGELQKLMGLQKPLGGDTPLNLATKFVLLPWALRMEYFKIMGVTAPGQASNVIPDFITSPTPIIEGRLDAASTTAYYVAANPAEMDTIVYGGLEGQTGPRVENEIDFHTDAVEYKVSHDFGAGVVDYRGLAKNAGV